MVGSSLGIGDQLARMPRSLSAFGAPHPLDDLRDDLLGEETHRTDDLVVGEPAAREGAHEVGDPERLVVLADLVGDLLGVASDGGLIQCYLFREREQVLAYATVEAVLV